MSASVENSLKTIGKELAEIRKALNRLCRLMQQESEEIDIPDLETYFEKLEDDRK